MTWRAAGKRRKEKAAAAAPPPATCPLFLPWDGGRWGPPARALLMAASPLPYRGALLCWCLGAGGKGQKPKESRDARPGGWTWRHAQEAHKNPLGLETDNYKAARGTVIHTVPGV